MGTMDALTRGIADCGCGRAHACPIDAIEIGGDALARFEMWCAGYAHMLLVADENTWAACGERAFARIAGRAQALVLKSSAAVVVPNEARLAEIEAQVTPQTELIVGVGSGVINDLCKQVSFAKGLPYAIIATAPSMDGYASVGAALILGGMKVTLNARPPRAIFAEAAVLAGAPMEMIVSGWGDIIGKYSCLNDWKLSALLHGEYFCRRVYDLVMDTAKSVEALAPGVRAREEGAICALMQALVTVGVAMSYVGNSRPASGSEHHLSHFFEITGILHGAPYYPHGTDVLYSAVVTARLRERLLCDGTAHQPFDRAAWEKEIRRIYAGAADGVIALQDKLGWHGRDDSAAVQARWDAVCDVLRDAPDEQAMRAMVRAIGLDMDAFDRFYGAAKIGDAIRCGMDLKDRYSVLWLFAQHHAPIGWEDAP